MGPAPIAHHYRSGSPPPATTIRLEALNPASVRAALAIFAGALVLLMFAVIGTAFVPRADRALARVVATGGITVTAVVTLLMLRPRMKQLHYLLEIGDAGSSRIRLLAPNGAAVADVANGSLRITRTNYARAGRHGRGWLRPGFRIHHPQGTFLVGTLFPQLPWDHVGHDPARPDFELSTADHESLADRVRT